MYFGSYFFTEDFWSEWVSMPVCVSMCACACVCVSVWETERQRDSEADTAYLNSLGFLNEPPADWDQSLLRPRMKPVNSRAVNYGWELPSSPSQRVTNGRETQNDLWRHGGRAERGGWWVSQELHCNPRQWKQGMQPSKTWNYPKALRRRKQH